jgi:hypothetical protein
MDKTQKETHSDINTMKPLSLIQPYIVFPPILFIISVLYKQHKEYLVNSIVDAPFLEVSFHYGNQRIPSPDPQCSQNNHFCKTTAKA